MKCEEFTYSQKTGSHGQKFLTSNQRNKADLKAKVFHVVCENTEYRYIKLGTYK